MNIVRSIALAGLLALSPLTAFAKDFSNALSWAPDNAEAVLALDTDGISKSAFFKAIQPTIFKLANLDKANQNLRKEGVDLVDIIDSVVFISSPSKGKKVDDMVGVVVLEGNFGTPVVKSALEKSITKDFTRKPDGSYVSKDATLLVSDKEIVVLSSNYADTALAAKKNKKTSASLSKLTKAYGNTGHALLAVKNAEILKKLGAKLPPLENAALRLDFSSNLKLELIANAPTANDAAAMADQLKGMLKELSTSPDAKDLDLVNEVQAASVSMKGNEVTLGISLSSAKAKALFEQL